MDTQERYAVYHAHDLFAMVAPQAAHWFRERSRHYTHVADVEAPLEQVFALTNHIDHPWTSNPQVIWHSTASPVRSTSVGDVIVSQESRSGLAGAVQRLAGTRTGERTAYRGWWERRHAATTCRKKGRS